MSKQQRIAKKQRPLSLTQPSTPTMVAGPSNGMPSNGMMFNPYMPMFNPYQLLPQTEAASGPSAVKPWEVSTSSSDEGDFIPKKKRKASTKSSQQDGSAKRGPGRPRKVVPKPEAAGSSSQQIIKEYPVAFSQKDTIAYQEINECAKCKVYVGQVAMIPCGHHKYCFGCVNKLRKEALTMQRAAKCPADGCFDLVESWVQLFNVCS